MILHTIIDRGDNYKYLNGELKLDEFEVKDSSYPFYEEWLKNYILKILSVVTSLSQLF